jgi:tetratricopeptide (TPR) repeat protein
MLLDAETELNRIKENIPAVVNLGNIAFVRGQYDDAESLYRESLRREPGNALARLGLARTLYEQGDYTGARAEYQYLENSDLAGLYPYLGSWRQTLGQPLSYSDRLITTLWMDAEWQLDVDRLAAALPGTVVPDQTLPTAGSTSISELPKTTVPSSTVEQPDAVASSAAQHENESPVLPAFYRIVLGDTLIRLAQRDYIYGDWTKWIFLYKANQDKFPQRDNPDLILPGMLLSIPSINGEERRGVK